MKFTVKSIQLVTCAVILTGLTGCFPHRTLRSLEVRGRILDARTHLPVVGANIFLTEHPTILCKTDSSGDFVLKATHNFHLGSIPPEGDLPQREYWDDKITISHGGFTSRSIEHWPVERGSDKGDILLEPK